LSTGKNWLLRTQDSKQYISTMKTIQAPQIPGKNWLLRTQDSKQYISIMKTIQAW